MTAAKYPRGWNDARIRGVLEYYESQTDEEAAAEIESALEHTTMEVPPALVLAARELIGKRGSARSPAKKTHNSLQATNRSQRKTKSEKNRRAPRAR
jgi:hypothetical protein